MIRAHTKPSPQNIYPPAHSELWLFIPAPFQYFPFVVFSVFFFFLLHCLYHAANTLCIFFSVCLYFQFVCSETCVANSRNMTGLLIRESLKGHWAGDINSFYFAAISPQRAAAASEFCRYGQSPGKGTCSFCPGIFIPGIYSVYDLPLTLTEKKRAY